MWLINAATLRLEGFVRTGQSDLNAPRYAILSHRWGDEEVTFQDINDGRPEGKKGYQKIQGAAAQAIKDGLAYVWVDTCCIDKTSSSELSESINSMFAWYRDASICYAYLDDVPSQASGVTEFHNYNCFTDEEREEVLRSPFATSKWFTRGWTLQEFIAPREVKFYNRQWQDIGTKQQLAALLAHVTGVDEDIILHKRALRDVCVARKMSWAARRTTTRVEDTAYCLLGLFGIHLPLLYGEGANAFIRLQQEIIRVSDDQSLFAWSSPDLGDRGLFAPRPRCFSNAGRIVRWETRRGNEPWALTNYGLRLQLPLVRQQLGTENKTAVAAVLACRYEDDFTGPLGLMLMDTDSPTVFDPFLSPRLVILHLERANKAEVQTLYISAHKGSTSLSSRAGEAPENRKCWVRFSVPPASGWPDFEVQAAFPSRYWSTTTKTMWVRRHSNMVNGALHMKNRDGKEFVVAFGYPGWLSTWAHKRTALKSLRGQVMDSWAKAWVRLVQPREKESLEQLCNMDNLMQSLDTTSSDYSTSTYRAPDGSWEATARIQAEVIMGEELYTVDVRIVRWAVIRKEKEKEKLSYSRFRSRK